MLAVVFLKQSATLKFIFGNFDKTPQWKIE